MHLALIYSRDDLLTQMTRVASAKVAYSMCSIARGIHVAGSHERHRVLVECATTHACHQALTVVGQSGARRADTVEKNSFSFYRPLSIADA